MKKTGCYVYAYLRSEPSEHGDDGSPYYIGKGKHRRGFYARAFDKRHNIHIPADKSKVVILADDLSDNDARQAEMLLISLHGRIDLGTGCLRNLTDGGEGCEGRVVTEATRAKISKNATGKYSPPWTEERRIKASVHFSGEGNPFYGKTHTEESKQRGAIARTSSEAWVEGVKKANKSRIGIPLTEAHKEKLRIARKDRVFSEETCRKISEAQKGKHRRNDIPDSDLIKMYSEGLNCAALASVFGTSRSTISWRLREAGVLRRPSGFQKRLSTKEALA